MLGIIELRDKNKELQMNIDKKANAHDLTKANAAIGKLNHCLVNTLR